MASAVRTPAVAGRFYPGDRDDLVRDIRTYSAPDTLTSKDRIAAIGCIAPHAGYMYSGPVAGAVFSQIEIPKHCIILCPNHTGRGVPLAAMTATAWQTPLGEVPASSDLGSEILRRFPLLEENSAAHRAEHAIEVQLPFLQVARNNLHILPIAIGTSDFEVLHGLGEALAGVIAGRRETILIVASSDMNHYESDAVTRVKDRKAIDQILALDARGLWETVRNEHISMCGFGPAVIMLTAATRLGATSATLVRYATSGDVSGDFERVVGYAGIVVK